MTAAEQAVARLDSYSQEQHTELLNAARWRADERRRARRERARLALARLLEAFDDNRPEIEETP